MARLILLLVVALTLAAGIMGGLLLAVLGERDAMRDDRDILRGAVR